jgi:hypothetical protein
MKNIASYVYAMILTMVIAATPLSTVPARAENKAFCPPIPGWVEGQPDTIPEDFDIMQALIEGDEEFTASSGSVGVTTLVVPYNTRLIGSSTFQAKQGVPLQIDLGLVYWGLVNTPPGPVNVRFYLIVNEQPMNIGQGNLFQDITLAVGTPEVVTFNLPPMEQGIYDILIAGIPNFDREPAGIVGGSEPSNMRMFTHRITVVAGEDLDRVAMSGKQFTAMEVLEEFSSEESAQVEMMPPVTLIPTLTDEPFWWASPDNIYSVKPETLLNFNLLTRYQFHGLEEETYDNGKTFTFALLAFQDYEQIYIGSENPVLYGQFTENASRVRIPLTIETPSEAGRYDLVFFKLNYPGVPLCRLTMLGEESFESLRVAIQVEE